MLREEKVIKVIDGDTLMTQSRKGPVRLANVNAPRKGSRDGPAATQVLRGLVLRPTVSVETVARDKYGRSGQYVVNIQ